MWLCIIDRGAVLDEYKHSFFVKGKATLGWKKEVIKECSTWILISVYLDLSVSRCNINVWPKVLLRSKI
jgi:hypothetical protein